MKRILSFYVCFAMCMALFAQATDLTIDNQTPGWLSSKINYGDQETIENLKVTGFVNLTDLRFIGSLMENRNLHGCVDLSEVYVVGSKDNYMGKGSFNTEGTVNRLILPKTLEELENCLTTSSYPLSNKYLHVDTLVFAPENMTFVNGSFFSGSVDDQIIGVPNHLIIGEHITTIAEKAFYKNLGLQSVKIQGTQIKVENGAFTDCSDLQTIDIHGKFKTVGDFAFRGTNITKLDMDKLSDVEYLGDGAFDCPLWLDTLYVPEKIEYFYENSFTFNNKAHVFLGKKIKELSGSGFWHSGLNLHFKSSTPPKFVSYYDSYTFYVPKGATDAYKAKVCINGHQATIIEENPLEGINIATQKVKLEIGETQKVIPTFIPADADDLTLEWSSKDLSVATVDADGIVSGVAPGTTTILATSVATGVQGSCEVIVIQHATDIQMETSQVTMTKLGETTQLNVTVLPENTTDKTVKWTSSNSSICSVTSTGKIVAMGYGDAVVMAVTNDGEIPATCVVKVMSRKPRLIYMVDGAEYQSDEHEVGESVSLLAAPEKDDYMFVGWTMVMPTDDVTLTAVYAPVTNVNSIRTASETFQIFTPDGIRRNVLQQGVNILRYSDGTEKKVVIQ